MVKLTREIIQPYIDQGLVNVQTLDDLAIYNYTPRCQFEKKWDDVTRACRGLIMRGDEIVARPFPKFFNLNEQPETEVANLPAELPIVTEKFDGSLGILYQHDGQLKIATRGSFISDQAIEGTKILQEKGLTADMFNLKYFTYLFEIVYPENRIVVEYGGLRDLFLIGIIQTETGKSVDPEGVRLVADQIKSPSFHPVELSMLELEEKLALNPSNEEGFVAQYSNGLRVKFKYAEYLRLHKILTGVSLKSIWEMLKNGEDWEKVYRDVPDEFYSWLTKHVSLFQSDFRSIYLDIESAWLELINYIGDRKAYADKVMRDHKKLSGELFKKLDGKDYKDIVWKKLKPRGQNVFKIEV